MTKRNISAHHALPPKPQFIEFTRSDRPPSPTVTWSYLNQDPNPNADGNVNFHRPVSLEEPAAIKWRKDIATYIAEKMYNYTGPHNASPYVLKSWPDGYLLFDHNKGPVSGPRHDPYLLGSNTVHKFRSTREFFPHALWLMQPNPEPPCQCKYCSRKTQSEVVSELGLPPSSGPVRRPKPPILKREQREKKKISAQHQPYAAIHPKPKVPVREAVEKQAAVVPEREKDVRAACVKSDFARYRIHREHELVWCAMDPIITGPSPDICIPYWPGIIEEVHIKPFDYDIKPDPVAQVGLTGSSPPWGVGHRVLYQVRLIASNATATFEDSQVLPYQGWVPSSETIHYLKSVSVRSLNIYPERLKNFSPVEGFQGGDYLLAAAAPWGIAIQIASVLSGFWSPTDEWEYVSTVADQIRTQTFYQGLWWGSERIWVNDLVRLKLARSQIVSQGTSQIAAPSEASPATIAWLEKQGVQFSPQAHGAGDRGTFLKISGLYIPEGMRELRVCGMLYELADEDWVDPQEANSASQPPPESSQTKPFTEAQGGGLTEANLSSPVKLNYSELPLPPTGYKFRPILPADSEVHLELSFVSGRYYPQILAHPLLESVKKDAFEMSLESLNYLWALEGLVGGFYNAVEPTEWKRSRQTMMRDAEAKGRQALMEDLERRQAEEDAIGSNGSEHAMEVDHDSKGD